MEGIIIFILGQAFIFLVFYKFFVVPFKKWQKEQHIKKIENIRRKAF